MDQTQAKLDDVQTPHVGTHANGCALPCSFAVVLMLLLPGLLAVAGAVYFRDVGPIGFLIFLIGGLGRND